MLTANEGGILWDGGAHQVPGRIRASVIDKTVFNIEVRIEPILQ